ncbi:caspase family protein [Dactylosporangium darangshiense]|uniref:caspase family protein n=1 Tax=Dactylosporangium darangshiense TaxID=579108 RepID=UPI00362E4B3D
MGTIYALMVGIDRYDNPKIPDLLGCRNDVLAATEVLRRRAAAGTEVRDVTLLDGEATGAAIVEGFRTHLAQAGPGDVALFWFSGHGSTHPVPEAYWHLEPDGRMETLVCADSRVDGRPELLDKELALLLDDVCEGGAHVVAVLDSCHSGGAMRREYRVRSADPAGEPFECHLVPDLAERYAGGAPAARHVTLAACQKQELAAEEELDDVHHGRFTWALLRALRRAGPETTYRELLAVAQGEVERRSATQRPLVFPPGTGPADRRLLGGEAIGDPPTTLMRYGRDGWEVNAGAAHGVEAGPARFAVGGPDPAGNVDVTRAEAGRSLVAPVGWVPDTGRVYAVELRRPSRPTLFGLAAGLAPGLAASLRAAVAAGDPHVRIVADAEDAELLIGPAHRGVRLTTGNREVIADVRCRRPWPTCATSPAGGASAACATATRASPGECCWRSSSPGSARRSCPGSAPRPRSARTARCAWHTGWRAASPCRPGASCGCATPRTGRCTACCWTSPSGSRSTGSCSAPAASSRATRPRPTTGRSSTSSCRPTSRTAPARRTATG